MTGLRRALWGLGIAGVGFGLVLIPVVLGSEHTPAKGLILALALVNGWGFIGAGLYAWWRRPESNFGPLMTATGFGWFVAGAGSSDLPLVFIVASLLGNVFIASIAHLLLSMPDGRLETRAQKVLAAGTYALSTVFLLPFFLFAVPDEYGCENCPPNLLLIEENEALADLALVLFNAIALVLIVGVLFALARSWRGWSAPQRRSLGPMLFLGLTVIAVLLANTVLDLAGLETASEATLLASLIGFGLLPYVFLATLARGRMVRGGAVGELVRSLGRPLGPGEMRDALARALGDPTLQLAFWIPDPGRYVDGDGRPVALPEPGSGRAVTDVELDGRCVGAMIHDSGLDSDPALIGAAGGAVALALENERLDAELRCRVEDLHASRARLVEAAVAERRRLERDLHDGAQQRLVSLALDMRLARAKVDTDPRAAQRILDDAGEELDLALGELRELARGIHPAVLSDRGLGAALESLAGRAPVRVDLDDRSGDSLPQAVESAAYFVVAEALTNVAKYANASHASVEVARENGDVLVRVSDDGVGGADPGRGTGLRGLADRISALDGRLSVESVPGSGTTVRARMPCA